MTRMEMAGEAVISNLLPRSYVGEVPLKSRDVQICSIQDSLKVEMGCEVTMVDHPSKRV